MFETTSMLASHVLLSLPAISLIAYIDPHMNVEEGKFAWPSENHIAGGCMQQTAEYHNSQGIWFKSNRLNNISSSHNALSEGSTIKYLHTGK